MNHQDEVAHGNPMLAMADEGTGDKYARAVWARRIGRRSRRHAIVNRKGAWKAQGVGKEAMLSSRVITKLL